MKGPAHTAMGGGAEFDAIRRMLALWGDKAHGIGDDAAVLSVPAGHQLVVSTDATIEDVHFRHGWLSPEEIGARAAAAALSDLAAMAARPVGLLVALSLPAHWRGETDAFARGIGRVASSVECPIVGGNLSAGAVLSFTITVLGACRRPLRRSGASAGDAVFVTGRLGGPGAALRSLTAGARPRGVHRARFAAPRPRIAEATWLAEHGATAAIDISDGLAADATHIGSASGVTLAIEAARVPCVEGVTPGDALSSGEEYELLVTAPAASFDAGMFERTFGIRLTAIGTVGVNDGSAVRIDGEAVAVGGHDHLA